ncbi:hypothetical protein ACFL11_01375 [Patescibacteria group bacterium]
MLNKIVGILILIIFVISVGYFSFEYKNSILPLEKELEDEISVLLDNIEKETGVNFSAIKQVEFKWIAQESREGLTIKGKGFEAKGVTGEKGDKVESFFKDNIFEIDLYNITDGTVVGLKGYKKNNIVCTFARGATGYKKAVGQWIPSDPNKIDIEVRCGKLKGTEGISCITKAGEITLSEAEQIILESECANEGTLKEIRACNENTNTWWIDLDVYTKKENCSPACVVNVETRTAEINWRCTGALLPINF